MAKVFEDANLTVENEGRRKFVVRGKEGTSFEGTFKLATSLPAAMGEVAKAYAGMVTHLHDWADHLQRERDSYREWHTAKERELAEVREERDTLRRALDSDAEAIGELEAAVTRLESEVRKLAERLRVRDNQVVDLVTGRRVS